MNKQIIIGIFFVIILIGLSGCNEISNTLDPEKKRFVGTWKYVGEAYSFSINFFSDGTYVSPRYFNADGIYEIKDESLVLTANDISVGAQAYSYSFSDNDNILTLGGGWIFTKQ